MQKDVVEGSPLTKSEPTLSQVAHDIHVGLDELERVFDRCGRPADEGQCYKEPGAEPVPVEELVSGLRAELQKASARINGNIERLQENLREL